MLAWQCRRSAKACGLFLMIISLITVPFPPAVAVPVGWQGPGLLLVAGAGRAGWPLAPSGLPVPWEGLVLAGPWSWTANGPLHLCYFISTGACAAGFALSDPYNIQGTHIFQSLS